MFMSHKLAVVRLFYISYIANSLVAPKTINYQAIGCLLFLGTVRLCTPSFGMKKTYLQIYLVRFTNNADVELRHMLCWFIVFSR